MKDVVLEALANPFSCLRDLPHIVLMRRSSLWMYDFRILTDEWTDGGKSKTELVRLFIGYEI